MNISIRPIVIHGIAASPPKKIPKTKQHFHVWKEEVWKVLFTLCPLRLPLFDQQCLRAVSPSEKEILHVISEVEYAFMFNGPFFSFPHIILLLILWEVPIKLPSHNPLSVLPCPPHPRANSIFFFSNHKAFVLSIGFFLLKVSTAFCLGKLVLILSYKLQIYKHNYRICKFCLQPLHMG